MIDFLIHFFSKPIKIIALVTFFYALTNITNRNKNMLFLLVILFVCILTEIVNSILISNGVLNTGLSTTIGILVHNFLWLYLLSGFVVFKKLFYFLFVLLLGFVTINLFFIETSSHFNYYSFVASAFIYITIFIYESFFQLKRENFKFFTSNNYLLLCSPLFFFFCLSFLFGFKSRSVTSHVLFDKIKLYDFVIYFVNFIYYTLINIYIYREKKLKHA